MREGTATLESYCAWDLPCVLIDFVHPEQAEETPHVCSRAGLHLVVERGITSRKAQSHAWWIIATRVSAVRPIEHVDGAVAGGGEDAFWSKE